MVQRTLKSSLQIGEDFVTTDVVSYTYEQELGRPATAVVTVEFDHGPSIESALGDAAVLVFGHDEPHVFRGTVDAITIVASSSSGDQTDHVRFTLTSFAGLLNRSFSSIIFQEESQDVQVIVTKVLRDHGLPEAQQNWHLTGKYAERPYVVQYQETALAFISRLLEEEGIVWYAEQADDKEIITFYDDTSRVPTIIGDPILPFVGDANMEADNDDVVEIRGHSRVTSGRIALRDYNFETPTVDMEAVADAATHTELEVYDYPGCYKLKDEGKQLANVRLEAIAAARKTVTIDARCPRLAVGRLVTLELTPEGIFDLEYLVTSVVHRFDAGDENAGSEVTATLIESATPYRVPQTTPRPVVHGPHTARVVGREGAEPETLECDEHGRVKVKFHWDLGPHHDDQASCFMRVGQLQTSGSVVLPRLDWEVVVDYREGNPDEPIVTGRLYNGRFMPPYALPEGRTRTSLQSASSPGGGGTNEIRFEDAAGSEEIMINAQYDQTVFAANNKTKTVGNNETTQVAVDESITISGNESVQVTMGQRLTVGADQSWSIGGNANHEVNAVTGNTVDGDSTTAIGGNHFEMDGNPLKALLEIAAAKATELAQAKAKEVMDQIDAAVQEKVDQVMGPINEMQAQAEQVANGLEAMSDGNLAGGAAALAEAGGMPLPGPFGDMAASADGGGGEGGGEGAGGEGGEGDGGEGGGDGGEQESGITHDLGIHQAADAAIASGIRGGANALGSALGLDPIVGVGESQANRLGPEGTVEGIDEADRAKGPGHSLGKVTGDFAETTGTLRTTAALMGIKTEIAGDHTETVGIAKVTMALGNITAAVEGDKTETALGTIIVSRADENEKVTGAKTTMVGAVIAEQVAGNYTIEASSPATFVGAFQKIQAKKKITFKCGGTTMVLDKGGITIEAPIVTITAGKISLTKATNEV